MRLPTGSVGVTVAARGQPPLHYRSTVCRGIGVRQAYYNLYYTDTLPISPGELPLLCLIIFDFSLQRFYYKLDGKPIIMQTQTSIWTDH